MDSAYLKNPYNNLLFDHIDEFKLTLIFWVQILSYLALLQEGTTAGFPAIGSSHNRPCYHTSAQNILHYFLFKVNQKEWKGINELLPYFGFQETEFIDIFTVSLRIDGLQEPHS